MNKVKAEWVQRVYRFAMPPYNGPDLTDNLYFWREGKSRQAVYKQLNGRRRFQRTFPLIKLHVTCRLATSAATRGFSMACTRTGSARASTPPFVNNADYV